MSGADGSRGGGSTVPGAAPRGRPYWLLFAGLAALIVIVDQATKSWLVGRLEPGGSMEVLGDLVRLTFVRNSGALFGLFQDSAPLFGLVSIAVVGGIVWYHGTGGRSALLSTALGLLLGGAIGNLIDRLRLGYVVDFVDAGIGAVRFYTFNVADAAISTALVLLLATAVVPMLRPARTAATDG